MQMPLRDFRALIDPPFDHPAPAIIFSLFSGTVFDHCCFRGDKMIRSIALSIGLMLTATAGSAQKAGVGAWENPRFTMLKWIEQTPALGWYYNWRTDQIHTKSRQRRSVEFVPMIQKEWKRQSLTCPLK